jgi:tetratricopeptide (TPR) repeat protein
MKVRLLAATSVACVLGVALLGSSVGCGTRTGDEQEAEGRITELPQPGPELSKELMIGLALAQNYHHKANVYLKEARTEQAVTALRQILAIEFPAGSPEGVDVAQDARARLAKILVTRGQLDEAMTVVDQGIATATRQSFFLANLHTARGEVLEARAMMIEDEDRAAATTARRQAIESYDRAISIGKALIEQLAGKRTGSEAGGESGGENR